jgi:hypothetical protein
VKLNNQKDFCAGLLFVAIGATAVAIARGYQIGTTMHMGPGYFPVLLGVILIALGLVIAARALWTAEVERLPRIPVRPLLLVTLSVLVFALAFDRFGLIPAIVAAVLVSCLAGHEFRWREALPLAALLAAASVLIFHVGLGLPFVLWSW